jgi:hypothetical protein
MKTNLTIFTICLMFCAFVSKADTQKNNLPAVSPPCDTLFLTDGSIRLVTVIEKNKESVVFQKCDSLQGDRYTLPIEKVNRLSFGDKVSEKSLYLTDPIGRKARRALVWTIVGTAIIGALGLYGLPGYILIAIGIVKAERILRQLKKLKDFPFERKARHDSRAAIILGMIMVIAPVALFLLISLLL